MNAIVAQFRQRFAAAADTPVHAPINRGTPNPPRRKAPGDAALAWCREWIPGFESHERQVKASEQHRAELVAKVRAS